MALRCTLRFARCLVLLGLAASRVHALRDETEILDRCDDAVRQARGADLCCRAVDGASTGAKVAYVTLIGGAGNDLKYRGFLFNVVVMAHALHNAGSSADLVALVMMTPPENQLGEDASDAHWQSCHDKQAAGPPLLKLPASDEDFLREHGVTVRYVGPLHGDTVTFGSMVFAKAAAWQLTEYEHVQFLDADIMPMRNMDGFFHLPHFSFCAGAVSPMNAGWFSLKPSCDDYAGIRALVGRVSPEDGHLSDWSRERGWGAANITWKNLYGREKGDWTFHHAHSEQGLFYYYFGFAKGDMDQVLYHEVNEYRAGAVTPRPLQTVKTRPWPDDAPGAAGFPCLRGGTYAAYVHFTGRSKPWVDPTRGNAHQETWWKMYAELGMSKDRTQIEKNCFRSPAGSHHRMPKGDQEA